MGLKSGGETLQNRAYLIVLNTELLEQTLQAIDFEQIAIDGIFMDRIEGIQVKLGEKIIPIYNFSQIDIILSKKENLCLLMGYNQHMRELGQMAKALHAMGVAKDKIINFTIWLRDTYLGNLKYAVSSGELDFFATGISYMEVGLDIKSFGSLRGVNLASTGQDLYYGYQTAKYVLERKPMQYCLIGLSPYSFLYDIQHSFSARFYQLQYDIAGFSQNIGNEDNFVFGVLKTDFKRRFNYINSADDADPNYMELKQLRYQALTAMYLETFTQELEDVSGTFNQEVMEMNIGILRQYLLLCHENHVQPICVVLPFSLILQNHYPSEKLMLFRSTLQSLLNQEKDLLVDLFDEKLGYEYFFDLAHLNQKGAAEISRMIAAQII